jgi:hypothetical protein
MPDEATIRRLLRKGTIDRKFVPMLCGTAFKNKGVQPLLDAVVNYLPSPLDIQDVQGARAAGEMGREGSRRRGAGAAGASGRALLPHWQPPTRCSCLTRPTPTPPTPNPPTPTPPRRGHERRRERDVAPRHRRRALLRAGVQDHDGSLRRLPHLLPRVQRQARVGLVRAQLEQEQEGAHRAPHDHARQQPRGHQDRLRRRHHRHRRPQGAPPRPRRAGRRGASVAQAPPEAKAGCPQDPLLFAAGAGPPPPRPAPASPGSPAPPPTPPHPQPPHRTSSPARRCATRSPPSCWSAWTSPTP